MIHLQTIPGHTACRHEGSGGFTGNPSKVTCPDCRWVRRQLLFDVASGVGVDIARHSLDRPKQLTTKIDGDDTRILFKPRIDEHLLSLADAIDELVVDWDSHCLGGEGNPNERQIRGLTENIRICVADLLTKFPRPT